MKTIFLKTFGCTLNQKDSEDLTKGLVITTDRNKLLTSDYILINTCGVKEQTETKIVNYLNKLKKKGIDEKKLLITGCLVKINKKALTSVFPKANYFEIKDQTKLKKLINTKTKNSKIKLTEIIIISKGCLGNCSYCAVKFARGKLISKSIENIKKDVEFKVKHGAKEIYLTSQDTGCYGLDINTNIIKLLKELIKIEGDFKIRLGMGNPLYFEKYKKEIVKVLKSEKIYNFLHIPLQSGNNEILNKMKRTYTIENAENLINYFIKNIPDLNLATDIIVGFPNETEDQFKDTIKTIQKLKFDIVNISRFGMRKGIEAEKYKDLISKIKKERSRKLTFICDEIAFNKNKKYLNKTLNILITEKGKNNSFIGKTKNYKTVVIKNNYYKLGQKLKVKITDIKTHYLIGVQK